MVQFVFTVRRFGVLHQRSGHAVRGRRDGNWSRRGLFRGRLPLASLVLTLAACPGAQLSAVEPIDVAVGQLVPYQPSELSAEAAMESVQWLASLALEKMPRKIDGDKDWGETRRFWAGVKLRFDDGKLKTNSRVRRLEHGRWVQYEIELPDPKAANKPTATIHQVQFKSNEETGLRRWQIDSTIVAPMKFQARVQRWNMGVKLFSLTIEGKMRLRMKSSALIGFDVDYSEIPPALVFDPLIEDARIGLDAFEVDRVSRIGGDAAEGWGEVVQEVIVETYLSKLNDRLPVKINQAIAKERDNLRLSLADWLNWTLQQPESE